MNMKHPLPGDQPGPVWASFSTSPCFIFQYIQSKTQTNPKQLQISDISCSLILPNCSCKCRVTNPVTSRMSLLLLKLLNKLLSLRYLVEETKSTGIQSVNYGIGKLWDMLLLQPKRYKFMWKMSPGWILQWQESPILASKF